MSLLSLHSHACLHLENVNILLPPPFFLPLSLPLSLPPVVCVFVMLLVNMHIVDMLRCVLINPPSLPLSPFLSPFLSSLTPSPLLSGEGRGRYLAQIYFLMCSSHDGPVCSLHSLLSTTCTISYAALFACLLASAMVQCEVLCCCACKVLT